MFEIYQDAKGEFRFRLKAKNGQNIMSSEGYSSKEGCKNGIESVKKNSLSIDNFERTETTGGDFRFNLKAGNGQIIGTSQNYATAASRDNGIESVMNNAPDAQVVEV
ncbi:MAG: hypothetical protein C4K58_07710 [Flavobacteriaceae bacterium]|nr:MAG: hypothetical protein C4K58_07710 [Flavobacteriaceae bacterium]